MRGLSGRRPEYPSLGSDGLAAVLKAIEESTELPARASADEVLARYSDLFERAFAQLSVMVGAGGAQAITQRAIRRASARLPALSRVAVSEAKILLDPIRGGSSDPEELQEAIEDLFVTTMDVLASLIGVDLLAVLLERMTSSATTGGAAP